MNICRHWFKIILCSVFHLLPICGYAADTFVRSIDVPSAFGVNIEWAEFEIGLAKTGLPAREVVDLMRPYRGGWLRYPGGEKANVFDWKASVGALDSRPNQYAWLSPDKKVLFGVDEVFSFAQELGMGVNYVLNLYGRRNVEVNVEQLIREAVDLVSHVKAKHPTVKVRWELGNELDWKPYNWKPAKILDRKAKFAKAMLDKWPEIELIGFSKTAGFLTAEADPDGTKKFNESMLTLKSEGVHAIAAHLYFEGRPLRQVSYYLSDLASLAGSSVVIDINEFARWPNTTPNVNWRLNWFRSGNLEAAIIDAQFLNVAIKTPQVRSIFYHQLGGGGPWQLIYGNIKTSQVYPSVPYHMFTLYRQYMESEIFEGSAVSSASRTEGEFQKRAEQLVTTSKKNDRMAIFLVNRERTERVVEVSVPSRSAAFRCSLTRISSKSGDIDEANSERQPTKIEPASEACGRLGPGDKTVRYTLPPASISVFQYKV